jgi:hypothetical protein
MYMHYSNHLKGFLITILTLTLTACGGSSGSASKPTSSVTPPAPVASLTLNLSSVSAEINENTSTVIAFSAAYSGNKTLTYSATVDGIDGLEVTYTGEALTLVASDMTQLINSGSVKLDVTDGSVSTSASLDVSIKNTSFFVARDNLVASLSNMKVFADNDTSAYNTIVFLTDIDVKMGLLPQENLGSEIERRGSIINSANVTLSEGAQSLISSLNEYADGSEGAESELDTYTEQTTGIVDGYIVAVNSVYLDVRSTGGNILPAFNFSSLNETSDGYSLFIGNPTMGNSDTGVWAFSENYTFLNSVVNSSVCYTL